MSKPVLLGIAFVAVVLAVIIWSSINMSQVSVKVCMQYEGRTNCAQVSGKTREFALRTAVSTACAPISGGVTGTIACEGSKPVSIVDIP